MKKSLGLLLLLFSLFGFSQNPEFVNNTWYLTSLIKNSVNLDPPSNSEVPNILLKYDYPEMGYPNQFFTRVCNDQFGGLTFDNENSTFTFIDLVQTLIVCQLQPNIDFESQYFEFYLMTDNGGNFNQPFHYEIINNGDGSSTMIVTSTIGDQAIYNNALLNIQVAKPMIISIYPNPIEDIVNIITNSINDQIEIEIYDINGKLYYELQYFQTNNHRIDMSAFSKGVYFVQLKNNLGKKQTFKLIKN